MSSKINLQTCEYARKSSIFQDNQLISTKHDDSNSGAWEMVVHELAVMCGLNVPEAKAEKFSRLGTTFLVKRFDRIESRRIHFSSAMTMYPAFQGDV